MNIRAIKDFLKNNKQPVFRSKQIMQAVYQDGVSSFGEISNIPKELREKLDREVKILSFEVEKVLVSADKKSAKAALQLVDGNIIETVLISPIPESWSVCVSTQAGCQMNCGFCATGQGGFKRNLTAEEITDQVLFWKQYLKQQAIGNKQHAKKHAPGRMSHVANIVYMGMGEPFLNWDQVKESLKILTDKDLFGFGSRSISVSTAGVPEGIVNFAKSFPQMNLALSLHFADDGKRSDFMPVNRKYNLADLRKALQDYFKIANRKVFIEYIILEGINNGQEDAKKLARYLGSIGKNQLLHVNLIMYNATGGKLEPSSRKKTQAFKQYLLQNKINTTTRKSLGEDIQGACGQLAGRGKGLTV